MTARRLPRDVHRIRLENEEFEGRNNAYLLAGKGPTALIDTGVATEDVRGQLEAGLADHGVSVSDVEVVVLTHWHYDHAGLAGHVQSRSGATVYAHAADAPVVEGGSLPAMLGRYAERLEAWGVPEAEREEIWTVAEGAATLGGEPVDVEPIEEGDAIAAGEETLRVLHTPGHTAGLVSLVVEGTRTALVGDVVLPVYTPNVGGADLRVDHPLATYRESLEKIADEGLKRLYPGHRDPIEDPTARIEAILDHHDERTRRVVEVLADRGPSTAWEVSAELFGDLSGIHVLHGPGEAFAHLDDLEARGDVELTGGRYRLLADVDADADADAAR